MYIDTNESRLNVSVSLHSYRRVDKCKNSIINRTQIKIDVAVGYLPLFSVVRAVLLLEFAGGAAGGGGATSRRAGLVPQWRPRCVQRYRLGLLHRHGHGIWDA